MRDEILYELPDGTAIYRGEKPPTDREVHRAPESYNLGNLSSQRLRELVAEYAQENT